MSRRLSRNEFRESFCDELPRSLNDDTEFATKNWASAGMQTLRNYVPSNVGVVGPNCKHGNHNILGFYVLYLVIK
jgi:hypothetical protein